MDKADILSTFRSDIRRAPERGRTCELIHLDTPVVLSNVIYNLSAALIAAKSLYP